MLYLDFRFLEVVLEGGGWGDGEGELCISYVFILHRCIQSFTLHFLPKKWNLFLPICADFQVKGDSFFLLQIESLCQRPKNLDGRVALPSGKFLRVRKVFAQPLKLHWKVSGWSGKFLDGLESFQMVWKFAVWSGKLEDGLERFRSIKNLEK